MGYSRGKNDIAGKVWLAMFGSLYENPDEDRDDEKETKSGRRSSESFLDATNDP